VTSEVEKRREQIGRQLDRVRLRLMQKSAGRYPSEAAYRYQQRRARELLADLEGELSALACPGEYDELSVATVADELGLTCNQVRSLIKSGEIEASGSAGHERVSRVEMERVAVLGAAELLRLSRQGSEEIFEEGVAQLRSGDLESAERAYRRLDARRLWKEPHAPAFLLCLELVKGDFEEARYSMDSIYGCEDLSVRAARLACASLVLEGMNFTSPRAVALRERLLAESAPTQRRERSQPARPGELEGELQGRVAYLAAAVRHELLKRGPRQRIDAFHIRVEMTDEELTSLLRDTIYTALYAENTFHKSEASRAYVAGMNAAARKRRRQAVLLEDVFFMEEG
jgi:hypothetical protein